MRDVAAPLSRLAPLKAALAGLADAQPLVFAALFDPAHGGGHVEPDPAHAEWYAQLRAFGLVAGDERDVVSRHRIRRLGERFYVLELSEADVYHQDVWPETDAMCAALDAWRPRGWAGARVADVGTGSGVIAIEAAARGAEVVATDLYADAITLARFNARLNGVDERIVFRRGHLFAPLAEERFDAILTAPHYGRVSDQLRLEVLAHGWKWLGADGRLGLATQLEWEEGAPLGVACLLAPLAERGMAVKVTPIGGDLKREWFRRAHGVAGVPSRHRFFVEVDARGPGGVTVTPAPDDAPVEELVPLARLMTSPEPQRSRVVRLPTAAVVGGDDIAALERLLSALGEPDSVIDWPLPGALLDACRFGARACTGRGGAAGAILSPTGAVRPCAHGGEVARAEHSLAELEARYVDLACAAEERRGCPSCIARDLCSRCLFPAALAEADYCTLIRAEVRRLPLLHRLLDTLADLVRGSVRLAPPVTIRRWPRAELTVRDDPDATLCARLAARWNGSETWIVADEAATRLFSLTDGRLRHETVAPHVAAVGAEIASGKDDAALAAFARAERIPALLVERALATLSRWFG